jgi:hypothetical protein
MKNSPPQTYMPFVKRVKHRVFKLYGQWYYMCGGCPEAHSSKRWRQTMDMLIIHAEQHKG